MAGEEYEIQRYKSRIDAVLYESLEKMMSHVKNTGDIDPGRDQRIGSVVRADCPRRRKGLPPLAPAARR